MRFKMITLMSFYLISANVFAFNWTINIKNDSPYDTILVGPENSNNDCFTLPPSPNKGVTVKKKDTLKISIDTTDTCRVKHNGTVIIAMRVGEKLSQVKVSFNHDGQATNYIVQWDDVEVSIQKVKENTNTVGSVNYAPVTLSNNIGVFSLKLKGTNTDDNFDAITDIIVNK